MKASVVQLLGAVLLLPSLSSAPAAARELYKWVDEQGVSHYGDRIPPEYANQEHKVFNAQGIEVGHLDAPKSAEQQAQDEKMRVVAEQRVQRDHNLLSTYVSVQEIERLRDQRLTLLTDQIKVTSQFLETLNGRMNKLRASSLRFKPYNDDPKAPPMPDQIAEDLVHLGNDIRTQEQNLREKRGEEATMSIQFESDIDRFKELKHLQ